MCDGYKMVKCNDKRLDNHTADTDNDNNNRSKRIKKQIRSRKMQLKTKKKHRTWQYYKGLLKCWNETFFDNTIFSRFEWNAF